LALAAIYLSQNRILNSQSDIQKTQTTIMKRQNVPVVTSHESGVKLHAGRPSLGKVTDDGKVMTPTDGNRSYVSVAVKNHGNEIAEQVQLACLVNVVSIEDPDIYTGVTELTVDGMHTKPPQGEGALIPPSRELSLLRGKPTLSPDSEDVTERKMFVAGIADQLLNLDHADKGDDSQSESRAVRFGFVLIFTNSVNERFKIPLDQAFSVNTAHFEEQEPDEVTITDLRDAANEYSIDDLMEDVDWSIPEEAFKDR
jgi:hypothetical protein